MRTVLYFIAISVIKFSNCNESDSTEINQIEISPFYDTIIFSDVVDIINELNKNLNSPFNAFEQTESESDENIEDLLSEYQHYLDKAHEQRRIYLQKFNKTKNKVPPLRHENFVKTRLPIEDKYKNYYYTHSYYNPNIIKMPPTAYNGPLDLFIPLNSAFNSIKKPERALASPTNDFREESLHTHNKIELEGKKSVNLPFISKTVNKSIKTPCFCKPGQIPCTCNCKQCFIPLNPIIPNDRQLKSLNNGSDRKSFLQSPLIFEPKISEHIMLDDVNNKENTLNVRIKVDIQLPKLQGDALKYDTIYNSAAELDDVTKELTSNNKLPTTYFNFPIPMDVFGFKRLKSNKQDSSLMHKIMIHKKKKSRSGSINKRHRKKLITFHNIKLSPSQTSKPILIDTDTANTIKPKINKANSTILINETIDTATVKAMLDNFTVIRTESPAILNTTQAEESIYFMVNISNNSENETDDGHKIDNSIELEYKTVFYNSTETTPKLREKRDISTINLTITLNNLTNMATSNKINILKKSNKSLLSDSELLYWPSYTNNSAVPKIRNITKIILERENKKAKLNMTTEAIRQNHTMAIEQAIFGQVDWNDIDTVAPPFISFVGKYINGVLTFCSETVCHSIKCTPNTCIHRICTPENRFNHLGHCMGSNKTDSAASMESITDLPPNVAFEIVDILQEKMLGKLFGKVTLCISSKCISFVTFKKTFIKSKCVAKDLNKTGHCPNAKKS